MKSLLAATTLFCVVLALVAQPMVEARRQQRLLSQVGALGGRVSSLGSQMRELSFGRFVLAIFDASYDRFTLYGLDFSGTNLRDADLKVLAEIEHVKELNLNNTRISDDGLRHLADMGYLSRLDLGGTRVTDQGLAQLRSLRNLASLRVFGTPSTYEVLEQLDAELPNAHFCEERAIEELKAAGVQVVDPARFVEGDPTRGQGIVVMSGSEAVNVIVGMNRPATLSPADVSRLSRLRSLRSLTLHTVTLGPEGIAAIQPLPKLKNLSIWFTNLTDQDLASIAQHGELERLTIYDADGITDDGLACLKALTKLQNLRVSACNGISQAAISLLERELPGCKIEYSKY